MAAQNCEVIPTEGAGFNIKNSSENMETEDDQKNIQTVPKENITAINPPKTKIPARDGKTVVKEHLEAMYMEHLSTGLSEKSESIINEKMTSIINEKVALTTGTSARQKLSNILKKVLKPALPQGRKSYWIIKESVPLDKVESFMSQPENSLDYGVVLQSFDKSYRTYKYIGYKLDVSKRNLLTQIPDLHRSIDEVAALRNESSDEFERKFLLSDHVYVKAIVPKTDSVYLWLGGLIMLEYKLDEAEKLLKNQLFLAIAKLKTIEHDQIYLRQQIAICLENWTNVYNWVMKRDAEEAEQSASAEEQQSDVEEIADEETDVEDSYTDEYYPNETCSVDGFTDYKAANVAETSVDNVLKTTSANSGIHLSELQFEHADEVSVALEKPITSEKPTDDISAKPALATRISCIAHECIVVNKSIVMPETRYMEKSIDVNDSSNAENSMEEPTISMELNSTPEKLAQISEVIVEASVAERSFDETTAIEEATIEKELEIATEVVETLKMESAKSEPKQQEAIALTLSSSSL